MFPNIPSQTSERTRRQRGFSLMELMIAMMIIAVIATLGMKAYGKYSATARYTKAQDTMKTVAEALDQYYLKHGFYPELGSWDNMVDANSPLVKENLMPVGMPAKDMWEQPFEGKSSKAKYELTCLGDPTDQESRPPVTREPGRVSGGAPTGQPAGQGNAPAAAPGAGK